MTKQSAIFAPILLAVFLAVMALPLAPAVAQLPTGAGGASEDTSAAGLTAEQAQALSALLRDEKAREALLQHLDSVGAEASAGAEAEPAVAPSQSPASFGREIAEITQAAAERIAAHALAFWDQLIRAPALLSAATDVSFSLFADAIMDLALVAVTAIAAFFIFRRIAKRIYRFMGETAREAGPLRTGLLIVGSVIIDAAVVLLAWAAAYAIALIGFGNLGSIGIRQTLFLNAFLIVELVKVGLRAILSPTTPDLRAVPLPDRAARTMSDSFTLVVSLLGYGQLLVVPIVNQNVGYIAGRSFSTVIALIAVGVVIALTVRFRRPVGDWLAGGPAESARAGAIRTAIRLWYLPVLAYLLFLFAIVLARPGGILFPLLQTSGEVLAAVIAGAVISNVLKKAMARGVNLPSSVNERLPLLERRLNAFVPRVLFGMRMLIVVVVIAFAVQSINLVNVQAWLESAVGVHLTGVIVSSAFIILLSFLVWLAMSSWIDYRLNPNAGRAATAREQTLLTLLRNAVNIVLAVITLMFVLSEIGIDIAPLIASAGVFGLAIGFGAQKLVQDIITGVFIQFENAMNVGDVVTVGGTSGVVERLTIRSVSLRDVQGVFHTIPFSSVDMVSNFMRGFAYHVADMGVAYRESVDDAKQAMHDAFDELREHPDLGRHILDDLQWQGLQAFGDSAVVLRARIKCAPGQQWAIGRAYNEIIKRVFDERGIEIPFPHQTIYFGEDKQGTAPPMRFMDVTRRERPADGAGPEPVAGEGAGS